jgi:hypothetical protein
MADNKHLSVLPIEIIEAIVFMTHDVYLYIWLGFSAYSKDLIMMRNGPGKIVSEFLKRDDNIRHILFMRKYVPDDILIAKAAMTMNKNMLRRIISICGTNHSDFAYRTCVSLGFVYGANMIDHDIKMSKFAIDDMYIIGNMPEMVRWIPKDGIINRMYYGYISRQHIHDMMGTNNTKLLVICLCNSYMEEIDYILSNTDANLYDALDWYGHEDNPYLIPYTHAKYASSHPHQPRSFVLCMVRDTWTKPCGLQIVEYFKYDDWMLHKSIITENVDEIHEYIGKDAEKAASLLANANKLHLIDVTRITQNQAVDMWIRVKHNPDLSIKILEHVTGRNSTLVKSMYVDAHANVKLHMIKTQLVTDRGFIAKHTNIRLVSDFRQFGPYIYTKRTFMQHIPSCMHMTDEDDVLWLMHNVKRETAITSGSYDRPGIRMINNVIYFHHVSQLIPMMVNRYAFVPDSNMTAIDASLYYMNA